ncbi:hypothetical protein LMHOCYYV_CDS0088 [Staphylococcus phage PG-2021_4]
MSDFLIMLLIFALLLVLSYFSMRYVHSSKYNTLNIIVCMFVGISAIRLSQYIDILPTTIMVLYFIPLILLKTRNGRK